MLNNRIKILKTTLIVFMLSFSAQTSFAEDFEPTLSDLGQLSEEALRYWIDQHTKSAPDAASVKNARGKKLSLHSMKVMTQQFYGACINSEVKKSTYYNSISYGDDTAIVFKDQVTCAQRPNFNFIGALPTYFDKDSSLEIIIGQRSNAYPGSELKFKNESFLVITASCAFNKNPWYQLGHGQIVCTFDQGALKSRFTFDVK